VTLDQANRSGDRSLRVILDLVALVCVVGVNAYLWVWVPTWRLHDDSFRDARSYWVDFAAPRIALSLVAGVPLGAIAAVVVDRRLKRRLHP
jgi:hypothetical protein